MISKVIIFLTVFFVARAAFSAESDWVVVCKVEGQSALQTLRIKFEPWAFRRDVRDAFNKKHGIPGGGSWVSGSDRQAEDNAVLRQFRVKSNLPYNLEVVEDQNNECMNHIITLRDRLDRATFVVDMKLMRGHVDHGQNRGCWFDLNNSYDAEIRVDIDKGERSLVKARCSTAAAGSGRKEVLRRGRLKN